MTITVRPARTHDVASIEAIIEPFVTQRILLGKDPVVLCEAIQQFVVAEAHRGRGVGNAVVDESLATTDLVSADVYAELVRSPDEGIAEFLGLARVKPNTLGNSRMLKTL
jgi:amino-acid N-acetyltransferase